MNVTGPDISFYQNDDQTPQGIDFAKMKSAGAGFVIVRAGQRSWRDPDFIRNWTDSRQSDLPRGSYWFYDSREDPKKQADLWISLLGNDLGELPLFADFEENYGGTYAGWANWKIFLERLKWLVAGHEIGIYTAFYYWNERVPANQVEYFKQYPLWIANYGASTPLVPVPWGENDWLFWQYTDKGNGALYGVESGNIDLNVFNGDAAAFAERFNVVPQVDGRPRTELTDEPFPGVVRKRFFMFDSWCHAKIIDMHGKQALVTHLGTKTCSEIARITGAQIVTNGGTYEGGRAIGLYASNGVIYSSQDAFEPWLNLSRDHLPKVNKHDAPEIPYNAAAGKRLIVEDGEVSPNISSAWYEPHPRTLEGVTADGRLITCIVDGRQPGYSAGVNLFEAAQIMISLGAVRATDWDGGGSSTMVMNGVVENSPIDNGVIGKERPVLNHLCIFMGDGMTGEETMPDRYECTNIATSTLSLRKGHDAYHEKLLGGVAVGKKVWGNEIFEATEDVYRLVGGVRTLVNRKGDKWLHVTSYVNLDNKIVFVDAWTAIVHMGSNPYLSIVDTGTEEPPTEPPTTKPFTLKIDGYKLFSGALEEE